MRAVAAVRPLTVVHGRAVGVVVALVFIVVALAGGACVPRGDFRCDRDAQCMKDGVPGLCEPSGVCSFADPGCPLGRRHAPLAGERSGACLRPVCSRNPVVELAAGGAHACLRRADGTVACWGRNDDGQLGLGSASRAAPAQIPWISDARLLALGAAHTCVGTGPERGVRCFGRGVDATIAAPIPAGVDELAAGEDFTCARLGGQVVCWGLWQDGQLGDGQLGDGQLGDGHADVGAGSSGEAPGGSRRGPVPVTGLQDAIRLTAGRAHACALRSNGAVVCWGNGAQGQLGDGLVANRAAPVAVEGLGDAIDVAAGGTHTCALRRVPASGTAPGTTPVVCWGGNGAGQLGDGSTTRRLRPTPVRLIEDARAVFAGEQHTCVLRADGDLFCFGGNRFGQLGEGTTLSYPVPVPALGVRDVVRPEGGGPRGVALGEGFTCALRREGTVWCFGDDRHRQLGGREVPPGVAGSPAEAPARVDVPGEIRAVSAGVAHTCALLATGGVWCWGEGQGGRLGDGTSLSRATPSAVRLPAGVTELRAGAAHTCARTLDRRLWCWGRGDAGQVGSGEAADALVPVPVEPLRAVDAFATGEAHTCAITRGQLWCWGRNQRGQLGLDDSSDALVPTLVPGLEGVVEVAAGAEHTCVRLADARGERASRDVRCFGDRRFGILGDGLSAEAALAPSQVAPPPPGADLSQTPRPVQLDRAVVELAAGARHTCARDTLGRVLCWGRGDRGQLGWGTTADRAAPVEVPGLSGAMGLALGRAHSCVSLGGGVTCFGANGAGQLGLPPGPDVLVPHDLPASQGVLLVAAGADHTCLVQSGALRCFGADGGGQLGSGRPLSVPRARQIPLICER